jgi:hypothetical protein
VKGIHRGGAEARRKTDSLKRGVHRINGENQKAIAQAKGLCHKTKNKPQYSLRKQAL